MKPFDFLADGIEIHEEFFDSQECSRLLAEAQDSRDFQRIFISEDEFRKGPSISGNNPRPGRNFLARLDTSFIFSSEPFQEQMLRVLGPRWRILDYKFVVGLAHESLPDWIHAEVGNRPIANLGPYVREEFRDMTYFRGIDFHQDILDFPDRESDFITVYIYLDDVDARSAPLFVMPSSHELGATVFPHKLVKVGPSKYTYDDAKGHSIPLQSICLTGKAGTMYFWHSTTLHGTQPTVEGSQRISVRILAEKNSRRPMSCELDILNSQIKGPLSLAVTRRDLDDEGNLLIRENTINSSE